MIPEKLYTMKNIVKINTESEENNYSISGRGKEPESELSDSSTSGKRSNETDNNQINNNKDVKKNT